MLLRVNFTTLAALYLFWGVSIHDTGRMFVALEGGCSAGQTLLYQINATGWNFNENQRLHLVTIFTNRAVVEQLDSAAPVGQPTHFIELELLCINRPSPEPLPLRLAQP